MITRLQKLLSATDFERNHNLVVHCLIVGVAFATYGIDRDDVVWRFIKYHGTSTRTWEHGLFALATALIAAGAVLCTFTRRQPAKITVSGFGSLPLNYAGEFLYAVGLAALLPLAGYVILIAGEGTRLLRLSLADESLASARLSAATGSQNRISLAQSARRESLKWALLISMVVFTITLRDRLADMLICASVVSAVMLNWREARQYG